MRRTEVYREKQVHQRALYFYVARDSSSLHRSSYVATGRSTTQGTICRDRTLPARQPGGEIIVFHCILHSGNELQIAWKCVLQCFPSSISSIGRSKSKKCSRAVTLLMTWILARHNQPSQSQVRTSSIGAIAKE